MAPADRPQRPEASGHVAGPADSAARDQNFARKEAFGETTRGAVVVRQFVKSQVSGHRGCPAAENLMGIDRRVDTGFEPRLARG